jgi:hypothetical protein
MEKLGLILTLVFLSHAAKAHAAEAPVRFPFVYGAISGNTVPLWIAKEQGVFSKV